MMRRRFVQRDERDEDRRRGTEEKSLPRLSRRDGRRHPVPADQMPGEERGDVTGEDREQDREDGESSVRRNRTEQKDVGETEADPPRAENRGGDRDRRRLARVSDPVQQEGEADRRQEAGDRPFRTTELGSEQCKKRADVCGKHERAQRSDEQRVLVQGNRCDDRKQREQPPASEVDDPEHERQADDRDRDARPEAAHRARLTGRRSDAFGLHSPRARHGDPRR
jgi:hypothetical protein